MPLKYILYYFLRWYTFTTLNCNSVKIVLALYGKILQLPTVKLNQYFILTHSLKNKIVLQMIKNFHIKKTFHLFFRSLRKPLTIRILTSNWLTRPSVRCRRIPVTSKPKKIRFTFRRLRRLRLQRTENRFTSSPKAQPHQQPRVQQSRRHRSLQNQQRFHHQLGAVVVYQLPTIHQLLATHRLLITHQPQQ
jgi:hypothetical protein